MFTRIGTLLGLSATSVKEISELSCPREAASLLSDLKEIAKENGYRDSSILFDEGIDYDDIRIAREAGLPLPSGMAVIC